MNFSWFALLTKLGVNLVKSSGDLQDVRFGSLIMFRMLKETSAFLRILYLVLLYLKPRMRMARTAMRVGRTMAATTPGQMNSLQCIRVVALPVQGLPSPLTLRRMFLERV